MKITDNFSEFIKKDIKKCDEFIEKGYASYEDVRVIVNKYNIDYPEIEKGLINYAMIPGVQHNDIENIKIIKSSLEYILVRPKNYSRTPQQSNDVIITNEIKVNISITETKAQIENNSSISEDQKKEILEKLDELELLKNSAEPKSEKWNKAKPILAFLMDKGIDIAIALLPHVISTIG